MKLLEKIKSFFINLYYITFIFEDFEYKYLKICKNKKLLNYIEKVALDLCKKENLKVFNVSFEELNQELNIEIESKKAVGVFRYINKDNIETYYSLIKSNGIDIYNDDKLDKAYITPRIEITEKGDTFTLLHEMGHYFIYKRNQVQSEPAADAYCKEFFDKHLPDFFNWIYQIDLYVYTNVERKRFTTKECFKYYIQYKEWIKNNPEYSE